MVQTGCVTEESERITLDNGCGLSTLNQIKWTEGGCPPDVPCRNPTPGIPSENPCEIIGDHGEFQYDSVMDCYNEAILFETTEEIQLAVTELGTSWKRNKTGLSKHTAVRASVAYGAPGMPDNVCDHDVPCNVSVLPSTFHSEDSTLVSKTFLQEDKDFISETMTKPVFTIQEKGHKVTRDRVPRLRGNLAETREIIYAINAGGEAHVDINGIHYRRDPLHGKIGTASDYGKQLIIGRVHKNDQILYQSERYHHSTFGYEIPVNRDGEYVLVLKFSEVYFNSPGMKVSNVFDNCVAYLINILNIFIRLTKKKKRFHPNVAVY
ncbi:MLEC [Cordylochernes scorpioides]|uniref:MLEC n=1 Tax=Cordylochernes scorpioides TaxID=51811 RepID=A0ABY6KE35_9ARAC|nr:MLEC [Cordylochernes scorpioides]